jgi:hypothetical protein
MAQNKAFEVYTELPSWAKGIVVVGGLAVTYIVGSTIYKKITSAQQNILSQNQLNQVGVDLQNNLNNGVQATFNSTQYNNFADAIASAFSGCDYSSPIIPLDPNFPVIGGYSDSGATIYNILYQFNNDVDFLALQKAFGVRTITKGWLCGGDYNNVSLVAAVQKQLNSKEISGLNNLLASRKISLRF